LPLTVDDERHGGGHQVVYGGRGARRRGPGDSVRLAWLAGAQVGEDSEDTTVTVLSLGEI
jgi:hypothetical protein